MRFPFFFSHSANWRRVLFYTKIKAPWSYSHDNVTTEEASCADSRPLHCLHAKGPIFGLLVLFISTIRRMQDLDTNLGFSHWETYS